MYVTGREIAGPEDAALRVILRSWGPMGERIATALCQAVTECCLVMVQTEP